MFVLECNRISITSWTRTLTLHSHGIDNISYIRDIVEALVYLMSRFEQHGVRGTNRPRAYTPPPLVPLTHRTQKIGVVYTFRGGFCQKPGKNTFPGKYTPIGPLRKLPEAG